MRIERERLIWMALAALDEAIDAARERPLAPTFGIRIALATAFAFSDGRRDPYDHFWKMMQDPAAHQPSPVAASYYRTTHMRTNLRGIVRSLGLPETPETDSAIHRARRGRRKVQSGIP